MPSCVRVCVCVCKILMTNKLAFSKREWFKGSNWCVNSHFVPKKRLLLISNVLNLFTIIVLRQKKNRLLATTTNIVIIINTFVILYPFASMLSSVVETANFGLDGAVNDSLQHYCVHNNNICVIHICGLSPFQVLYIQFIYAPIEIWYMRSFFFVINFNG